MGTETCSCQNQEPAKGGTKRQSIDYTLVDEPGVLTTKAPRLAALRSGKLKYESVGFDEVSVRLYGNTAVLTYRVTGKGQSKGQVIGAVNSEPLQRM